MIMLISLLLCQSEGRSVKFVVCVPGNEQYVVGKRKYKATEATRSDFLLCKSKFNIRVAESFNAGKLEI